MNNTPKDKSIEVPNQAPVAKSPDLDCVVSRVRKDFEHLKKDIQLLMRVQQQSELQVQTELGKLLNILEYARNRIIQNPQPIDEHHLREFERRGARRDWILLGTAIGIPTLISLLLHFFG